MTPIEKKQLEEANARNGVKAKPDAGLFIELAKARAVIAKIDAMLAWGYNHHGERVYTIQDWQGYDSLRALPEYQAAIHAKGKTV